MGTSTTATRWLTDAEQRAWRSWIAATALLNDRLERDLKHLHGMSLAEYEVLVRLSEAADHRLRMSDLASQTLSSKSRLSHQIARMEADGLVTREECYVDRRGAWAVLTEAGWHRLTEAAPDHVESVRRHLVDVLTPDQLEQLGTACRTVADRLEDESRDWPRR